MIVEKTINEILQNLDPHSYYIPKRDYAQLNDPLEGNFEGIGIEFRIQEDTVVVVRAIGGGPSEKLGIMAGDRIIFVDGENIISEELNNRKVVGMLKGPKGTEVNVRIKRKGESELIDFDIVRDEIPFYSIDATYMVDDKTAYIKIVRFARTTYDEFIQSVEEMYALGMENMVLDLRNNSGGYMKSAIQIADEFLEKEKLIVYTKGKAREKRTFYATPEGRLEDINVAVLINEGSASASEILAGALQDNDRGTIIGRRSFGKGLVQEGVQWPDGSAIRLTVARYYTPTGRSIQKPYEDGLSAYNSEAYDRYTNGELLSLDSIDLPDSLKYYTPEGKIVYGGGGILPDRFVPIDTVGVSNYFGRLNIQGLFYQFGFQYADLNREGLNQKFSESSFVKDFLLSEDLMTEFYQFAEDKGVEFDKSGAQESMDLIKSRLKASIARNIWGDNIFYEIVNKEDNVIEISLEALKNNNTYSNH